MRVLCGLACVRVRVRVRVRASRTHTHAQAQINAQTLILVPSCLPLCVPCQFITRVAPLLPKLVGGNVKSMKK